VEQVLAPVISTGQICEGVFLLWLEAPGVAQEASPGQFVMVRCGKTDNPLLRRPFSLHRVQGDRIALLLQVVGQGTEALSHRREGETVDLLGPLGNSFTVAPDSRHVLLIAGGIGIAPLVFLADTALGQGRQVTMLVGARTAAQLYPSELMPPTEDIVVACEDGSQGRRCMVTDLIPDYGHDADQVFACGPLAMYRELMAHPELRGKPVQVSLEVVMACGVGACYGCTIGTTSGPRRVCRDGPIFDLAAPRWEGIAAP
jgi:dihydroorotate dehydrogenase electron transfer subunit